MLPRIMSSTFTICYHPHQHIGTISKLTAILHLAANNGNRWHGVNTLIVASTVLMAQSHLIITTLSESVRRYYIEIGQNRRYYYSHFTVKEYVAQRDHRAQRLAKQGLIQYRFFIHMTINKDLPCFCFTENKEKTSTVMDD